MTDLTPETLRAWADPEAEYDEELGPILARYADAWEADIERADEAERVWFQEGYAQAEKKCEADRKRLEGYRLESHVLWDIIEGRGDLYILASERVASALSDLEDQPDDDSP